MSLPQCRKPSKFQCGNKVLTTVFLSPGRSRRYHNFIISLVDVEDLNMC